MKRVCKHIPELIFMVSTVIFLSVHCYLGWPGGDGMDTPVVREEQVITQDLLQNNILFAPAFRPENGPEWEQAEQPGCGMRSGC